MFVKHMFAYIYNHIYAYMHIYDYIYKSKETKT